MTDTDTTLGDATLSDAPVTDTETDPAAPYGRADDGTLLDRRGHRAPYGLSRSGLRKQGGRKNRKAGSLSQAHASRPSGRTITRKRRDAVLDQLGQLQGLCLMLGRATDHDGLLAEAVTIGQSGPPIATALADYAEDHDRLAQLLDRIAVVGPGFSLGMAVGAFVAQTARNFGLLPGDVIGTTDPKELADLARQMAEPQSNGSEPAPAAAA